MACVEPSTKLPVQQGLFRTFIDTAEEMPWGLNCYTAAQQL